MPYALLALLVLALVGVPFARGVLFWAVAAPLLAIGAWQLWHMEDIGWWALAALVVLPLAAWSDARTASKRMQAPEASQRPCRNFSAWFSSR